MHKKYQNTNTSGATATYRPQLSYKQRFKGFKRRRDPHCRAPRAPTQGSMEPAFLPPGVPCPSTPAAHPSVCPRHNGHRVHSRTAPSTHPTSGRGVPGVISFNTAYIHTICDTTTIKQSMQQSRAVLCDVPACAASLTPPHSNTHQHLSLSTAQATHSETQQTQLDMFTSRSRSSASAPNKPAELCVKSSNTTRNPCTLMCAHGTTRMCAITSWITPLKTIPATPCNQLRRQHTVRSARAPLSTLEHSATHHLLESADQMLSRSIHSV